MQEEIWVCMIEIAFPDNNIKCTEKKGSLTQNDYQQTSIAIS